MSLFKRQRKIQLKIKIIVFVSFLIIVSGVIYISSGLPKFIKDKSQVSIDFKLSPFNFQFKTEDYVFYINNKVFSSLMDKSMNVMNNMEGKTSNEAGSIVKKSKNMLENTYEDTSNFIYSCKNKGFNFFRTIEAKIISTFNGRVE